MSSYSYIPEGECARGDAGPVLGLGHALRVVSSEEISTQRGGWPGREDITEIYECIIKMIDKKVKIFINITTGVGCTTDDD